MRQNFPAKVIKQALARAKGRCEGCSRPTGVGNRAEVHHIDDDWKGGKPILENAIALGARCCHAEITAKSATLRAKEKRVRDKNTTIRPKSSLSRPRERRAVMPRDEAAHERKVAAGHQEHQRRMAEKHSGTEWK